MHIYWWQHDVILLAVISLCTPSHVQTVLWFRSTHVRWKRGLELKTDSYLGGLKQILFTDKYISVTFDWWNPFSKFNIFSISLWRHGIGFIDNRVRFDRMVIPTTNCRCHARITSMIGEWKNAYLCAMLFNGTFRGMSPWHSWLSTCPQHQGRRNGFVIGGGGGAKKNLRGKAAQIFF